MSQVRPHGLLQQRQQPFPTAAYQKTFKGMPCESCGVNDGTIVGAHFNFENFARGYKAPGVVAGLCSVCHDLADGRTGAPKDERVKVWLRVLKNVLRTRAYVKMGTNGK